MSQMACCGTHKKLTDVIFMHLAFVGKSGVREGGGGWGLRGKATSTCCGNIIYSFLVFYFSIYVCVSDGCLIQ